MTVGFSGSLSAKRQAGGPNLHHLRWAISKNLCPKNMTW